MSSTDGIHLSSPVTCGSGYPVYLHLIGVNEIYTFPGKNLIGFFKAGLPFLLLLYGVRCRAYSRCSLRFCRTGFFHGRSTEIRLLPAYRLRVTCNYFLASTTNLESVSGTPSAFTVNSVFALTDVNLRLFFSPA